MGHNVQDTGLPFNAITPRIQTHYPICDELETCVWWSAWSYHTQDRPTSAAESHPVFQRIALIQPWSWPHTNHTGFCHTLKPVPSIFPSSQMVGLTRRSENLNRVERLGALSSALQPILHRFGMHPTAVLVFPRPIRPPDARLLTARLLLQTGRAALTQPEIHMHSRHRSASRTVPPMRTVSAGFLRAPQFHSRTAKPRPSHNII